MKSVTFNSQGDSYDFNQPLHDFLINTVKLPEIQNILNVKFNEKNGAEGDAIPTVKAFLKQQIEFLHTELGKREVSTRSSDSDNEIKTTALEQANVMFESYQDNIEEFNARMVVNNFRPGTQRDYTQYGILTLSVTHAQEFYVMFLLLDKIFSSEYLGSQQTLQSVSSGVKWVAAYADATRTGDNVECAANCLAYCLTDFWLGK